MEIKILSPRVAARIAAGEVVECLFYNTDAGDEGLGVETGGRRVL